MKPKYSEEDRYKFDWERKVITLKNVLKELKTNVQIRDEDNERAHKAFSEDLERETEKTMTVLERISDWQEHYQPYLEMLESGQDKIDRLLRGDDDGTKEKP
jgi:type II secretory pathway predicted ATPase ExeA